jgi:heptosyltransferase-2
MVTKRILIIAPSWVGDMVMANALFQALKQCDPDSVIDVLAPPASLPMAKRMKEARHVIELPIGHKTLDFKTRYKIAKSLRGQYDQAIVLPNSFKSALIPFMAKIPVRTGWLGEQRYFLLNDVRKLDKKKYPLMVERYVALAFSEAPSLAMTTELMVDDKNREACVQKFQINLNKSILILCPGAEYGSSKRWPADHFSALAKKYIEQGWQVLIIGGKKEIELGEKINQLSDHQCLDLTGKTDLYSAIDIMSLATVVVTNDSGLMHIAASLSRPLIALYGSSSPDYTPPLSERVKIIRLGLWCSPCFKRECPLKGAAHLKCLRDITPAMVDAAIKDLL